MCEYNKSHKYFVARSSGFNYVEAHNIIPLSNYNEFDYLLDVEANVVSLCPLCDKTIHHARFNDKKNILEKIYNERKDRLKNCGIEISLEEMLNFYR